MGDWEEWLEQLEGCMDFWEYDDDDPDHPHPDRMGERETMDDLLGVQPSVWTGKTPCASPAEFNNHVGAIDPEEACPNCKSRDWLGPCNTGEMGIRHRSTCSWCPPCPGCGVFAQRPGGRRYHEPGCPKDKPWPGRPVKVMDQELHLGLPHGNCPECLPRLRPDGSLRHMFGCSQRVPEYPQVPEPAVSRLSTS